MARSQTAAVERAQPSSNGDEMYRALVEAMPEGVAQLSADGTIEYCNARFADMLKTPMQELVGVSIYAYTADGAQSPLENLLTNRTGRQDIMLQARDGTAVPLRVEIRPLSGQAMEQLALIAIDETAHAQIEEQLRQSRAEFQSLFESAPDAIVNLDADGKMVLVNTQMEKMFGYRRDELLGQTIEMLLPEQFRAVHIMHRASYVEEPSTRPMGIGLDLWGRHKTGLEFPVEISLSPIRTREGVLTMSIIRDISERRRAQRALQEQANLIELAHDAIIVRDMHSHILLWNHGAEELYGWSKEQAIGQVTHTLLQTLFIPSFDEVQTQLLSNGKWEGELIHTTRDQQRLIVASRQVLQRDEDGEPHAILEINRDITQRHEAEEQLRQSEERFRTLVEGVRDYAIFGLDARGYVTSWNVGAERSNGYTADEIIGKHFSIFFAPEEVARGKPQEELRRAAADGRYEEETYRVRKDGSRYYADVVITALHDGQGNLRGFSKVIRDITRRKQAEEEIHKLNRELEHRVNELATLNQELESFSYSVSHDLRAPLRGIAGFSQALAEDYNDQLDDQGKDYIRRINAATQRLTQLIDDLLMLSRVTRSEMHRDRIDLTAQAQAIAGQLQANQPERQVEFAIQPGLTAKGDQHLIRIALENLIGNAWKFTSKTPNARIEFASAGNEDGRTIYMVRDNGAGFDMTYADKLFGAFQRLHSDNEFPGTGIGLATVQRILRRHGGRAWAESVVGQGATFYFTL